MILSSGTTHNIISQVNTELQVSLVILPGFALISECSCLSLSVRMIMWDKNLLKHRLYAISNSSAFNNASHSIVREDLMWHNLPLEFYTIILFLFNCCVTAEYCSCTEVSPTKNSSHVLVLLYFLCLLQSCPFFLSSPGYPPAYLSLLQPIGDIKKI